MATIIRAKCKECHKENGDLFCFECKYILCSNCRHSHLKRKETKKHHIEKAYSNLVSRKPTCPRHGKEVVFYCDSCCLLICPTCMLEKHKNHDVQDIDDAILRKTETIKESIASFDYKSTQMKNVIDLLESAVDSYQVDNSIVAAKVKARGEALKSAIDDQVCALLQEVSEDESTEIMLKTDYIGKLKDKISLCESQKSRLENDLNSTSGIDLLMSYSEESIDSLDIGKEDAILPITQIRFIEPLNHKEGINELFGKLEKGCREVKNESEEKVSLKIGDKIRIKQTVTEALNCLGDVTHASNGVITEIIDERVTVDFPEFRGWQGLLSDVDLID